MMMKQQNKYEAVMQLLNDGYGKNLTCALMECVERYLPSLAKEGMVPCEEMIAYHSSMCSLLKALLKDEWGVDLEGGEE